MMKPAPVTPDAPLEVSAAMARIFNSCASDRSVLVAWARNSTESVM